MDEEDESGTWYGGPVKKGEGSAIGLVFIKDHSGTRGAFVFKFVKPTIKCEKLSMVSFEVKGNCPLRLGDRKCK